MKLENEQFIQRRQHLMVKMRTGSAAILQAATVKSRNADADYPFRQDSNFYYLTGFNEPEAILVLLPGHTGCETILFCREKDPLTEVWNGYMAGTEGAVRDYAIDEAWDINKINEVLPPMLADIDRIYFPLAEDENLDNRIMFWLKLAGNQRREGIKPPSELVNINQLLHEMRLFKSDDEQEMMRQVAKISAQGHIIAMQKCNAGITEYQLEAHILHHFAINGCRYPAYTSIVAGGANACTLHYIENNQTLKDNELVLIDAGAELEGYAGDITRTFPVSGKFTKEQRLIYQLVLDTQKACIEMIKPDVAWNLIHETSVQLITQGLIDLGLIEQNIEDAIESESYRDFYMHRIGHWLGLDVHDVGDYREKGEWRKLQSGMVMTVEPGIYIAVDNNKVAKKWRGIGVRIEDDVLVTAQGCEILTSLAPKEINEIETLMRRK